MTPHFDATRAHTQTMRVVFILLCALCASVMRSSTAHACSSCSSGDPTLTTLGNEQPYASRLRIGLDVRGRQDAIGDRRIDGVRIDELRMDATIAWAPSQRFLLSATMPTLARVVHTASGGRERVLGPGDAELRVRFFPWRGRTWGTRHLFAFQFGTKVPTGLTEAPGGTNFHVPDAQLGTGSFDAMVGASHAWTGGTWSTLASATLFVPVVVLTEERPGLSLRSTVHLQWNASSRFAVRAGGDARLEQAATHGGAPMANSGGFVAYATVGVSWSPLLDWLVDVRAQLPVVQALSGFHREGPIMALGVAHDL